MSDTAQSLARICRRLRLPQPRNDRSLQHGPWLTAYLKANDPAPRLLRLSRMRAFREEVVRVGKERRP